MNIGVLECYNCGKQGYESINGYNLCRTCQLKYDTLSSKDKLEWNKRYRDFKEYQKDLRTIAFGD